MRRLTNREHWLLYILAGVLFAVLSIVVLRYLLQWQRRLQEAVIIEESSLKLNQKWASEIDAWKLKEQWMNAHVDTLTNTNVAQAALDTELQSQAEKFSAVIKSQTSVKSSEDDPKAGEPGGESATPEPWIKIIGSIEVVSTLENVMRMAAALHQPQHFQTLSVLSINPEEAGKVKCEMRVIRWYRAP
jgi:hypothetical protein